VTDGVIVDVGGGVGSSSLLLAREHSHLNIIVQDTEKVINDAHAFWQREYPESVADGRVKLQTHSFFEPQPIKNAAVFFLRYVPHDWLILKALRSPATPETKLTLMEYIVPYAVAGPEQTTPGDKVPVPPAPVLPNLGYCELWVLCCGHSYDALFEQPGTYAWGVDQSYGGHRMATGGRQARQG